MEELDFRNDSVGRLFGRQLIPALLGMLAAALYVVVDGIFVGRGVGSDAIAAVNINNPLMTFVSGLGLMFGMGGGVMASFNLARGQKRAANRNLTQTVIVTTIVSTALTFVLCMLPRQFGYLLGADDRLIDGVSEYMFWYALCFPFMVMMTVLPFFIRLSNPKVPMWSLTVGAVLNVILDYTFIFILDWGLFGAAIATGIGQAVGAIIMLFYIFRPDYAVMMMKPKLKWRAIRFTARAVPHMVNLGFSVFLGEITLSIMGVAGNYAFMNHMGADGVAAYSIVCYVFPVILMIFNATVQSAQPIVSYNYGCGQPSRSRRALKYALGFSALISVAMSLAFYFGSEALTTLFIPNQTNPAWQLAAEGLPWYAADFLFFGFNTIIIGYYMSLEYLTRANLLTVVRGLLPVIFFFSLPIMMGEHGLWIAVPAADLCTCCLILATSKMGNSKI